MVASSMLMLLLTAIFGAFQIASSTFFKADAQTDMLQGIEGLGSRWCKDIEGSQATGVSAGPTAISVPTARDDPGNFVLDATGSKRVWQRYHVYFYDATAQTVSLRDVPIASPTTSLTPIEAYNDGSGTHPLTYWATGGRVLARQVITFTPVANARLFSLSVQANQKRYGSEKSEEVFHSFVVATRN